MRSNWIRTALKFVVAVFIVGCAGMHRSCQSCNAENFGADWVIVKMDMEGRPYRCWRLANTSVTNEGQSDGIYWASPDGHLVHISGHYNRVQVQSGDWAGALRELGLDEATCNAIAKERYDYASHSYKLSSEQP